MKKFLILYIVLAAVFLFLPIAHGITISASIPGSNANSTSSAPGAFVANFYQFALMIGGILAFGVIVFGGIKYTASAGNPSAQSDAKEWIWGALTGLLLLAGAYLVLNTINPQLVNLNLPTLNQVQASNSTATTPTTNTTTPPATSPVCGAIDSTGNQQSGTCANSMTCCSTKSNDTGFVTYSCKATCT